MTSENTGRLADNNATTSTAQIGAKKKSPILTELERIVYDCCNETGDTAKDALAFDRVLHEDIVKFVCEDVRIERIQEKLEGSVSYLRHQVAKLKAGVREKVDDEEEYGWKDAEAKAETSNMNEILDSHRAN